MDTRFIEVNKNIVSSALGGSSSLTSNINVEFIPDVMIVRGILFSNGASGSSPGAYIISANLPPQNCILGSFSENVFCNTNVIYYVNIIFV